MGVSKRLKVSVVIPVYNVEQYIGRCIESLKAQTLADIEFIFVDDCSTDASMIPVEAWAKQDERVSILRNAENLGAGPSRNRGIEETRGDYLSFIDPDDYVSPSFHEMLYAAATADGGHDIAKGQCVEIDAQGTESEERGKRTNGSIACQFSSQPLYLRFLDEHWTAIYKRTLFEDGSVRYGKHRKSEDTTFILRMCHITENIVIEPMAKYYYFTQREGSSVNRRDVQQLKYEIDGFGEKIAFFEESGFDANARRYLSDKLHFYLSNGFISSHANPSMAGELGRLSKDLVRVVGGVPNARFLRDDCRYRAFVERHVLLPDILLLPPELKADGAAQWIAFVSTCPNASSSLIDECARAMVVYIEHLAGEEGFPKAYLQVASQASFLPQRQRGVLWLALNRHLVSARNMRRTLGYAKRKALAQWQRWRIYG